MRKLSAACLESIGLSRCLCGGRCVGGTGLLAGFLKCGFFSIFNSLPCLLQLWTPVRRGRNRCCGRRRSTALGTAVPLAGAGPHRRGRFFGILILRLRVHTCESVSASAVGAGSALRSVHPSPRTSAPDGGSPTRPPSSDPPLAPRAAARHCGSVSEMWGGRVFW